MSENRIGIISSGGPAPGVNNVIHAATLEAYKRGFKTVGIVNGFKGVIENVDSNYMDLNPALTAQFSNQGGSVLGMTRYNPFSSPEKIDEFVGILKQRKIDKLIIIGGEGSAFLSYKLYKHTNEIQVVHVPKTIDNDLCLPNNYPSFGFETARFAGSKTVNTLAIDARTCGRWFIITCMGRRAGFLALSIGLSAGATLTLIPEEFPKGKYTMDDLVGMVSQAMDERIKKGKNYGVVIVAEGIIDNLNPEGCEQLLNCNRDEIGRIKYADSDIAELTLSRIRRLYKEEKQVPIIANTKHIGYELRCHNPVPFDIAYTKFLAFGAIEYLAEGKTGIIVVKDGDNLDYLPLDSMVGDNSRINSRTLDLTSDFYRVAKSFMVA